MSNDNVTRKRGKKNRKWDRNRVWCEAYARRGQREKNKARKLRKHLSRYSDDKIAAQALCHCE